MRRRTKAEIEEIDDALIGFAEEERPVTVRQCFYHLVSRNLISKTEGEYNGTICRRLTVLRKAGVIPYLHIADSTRWMRKPRTFGSGQQALKHTSQTFRLQLWNDQNARVEIWLEKDALSGVLFEVTQAFDVPLMVTRGYPSLSFMHSAAEDIKTNEKLTFIYYFGDHDPSGEDISRHVEKSLREFGCEFTFELAAVTEQQILEMALITRPTKTMDTRAKGWIGGSVEVDAIPPSTLRALTQALIEKHIDQGQWNRTLRIEQLERVTLMTVAKTWPGFR